jgi:hypothetical protein
VVGLRDGWFVSGGEGDLLADDAFELGDQVVLVVVGVVEVGAVVVEAGVGVVEQVPDDGEDGVAGGDDGAEFAAASGQASVAFAEEGVAAGQDRSDLAEGAGQPGVAFAGGGGSGLAGGLVGAGRAPGPGRPVRSGRGRWSCPRRVRR